MNVAQFHSCRLQQPPLLKQLAAITPTITDVGSQFVGKGDRMIGLHARPSTSVGCLVLENKILEWLMDYIGE